MVLYSGFVLPAIDESDGVVAFVLRSVELKLTDFMAIVLSPLIVNLIYCPV